MIETHHSGKRYYNYFEGIIKNTLTRVHYNGNDELPEGRIFHQLIYPDFNKRFDINTDNSEPKIGVVINQPPSTAKNDKQQQRYIITEK